MGEFADAHRVFSERPADRSTRRRPGPYRRPAPRPRHRSAVAPMGSVEYLPSRTTPARPWRSVSCRPGVAPTRQPGRRERRARRAKNQQQSWCDLRCDDPSTTDEFLLTEAIKGLSIWGRPGGGVRRRFRNGRLLRSRPRPLQTTRLIQLHLNFIQHDATMGRGRIDTATDTGAGR